MKTAVGKAFGFEDDGIGDKNSLARVLQRGATARSLSRSSQIIIGDGKAASRILPRHCWIRTSLTDGD